MTIPGLDRQQAAATLDSQLSSKARSLWMMTAVRLARSKSALIGGAIIVILLVCALFAPALSPHNPFQQDLDNRLQPPSSEHLLGTDQYGRDILSRLLYGSRITLRVGFSVVAIAGTLGCLLGVTSAYLGGWYDLIFQRLTDIMMTLPGLLLALSIVAVLGPGLRNAMIALVVGWLPSFVRVTRSSSLVTREMDYVLAAQALGAGSGHIIARHILPNVMSPFIVTTTVILGGAILDVAALGFLGLGAQPPSPEWGAMLSRARNYLHQALWMSLAPGISMSMAVVGFNLLGDGLRDALDPRLKE